MSEDKTCGSAQRRRQNTFEAHERRLSGRLSAGRSSRGQKEQTELRRDRQRWGNQTETKQWALVHITRLTGKTPTVSIIYGGILVLSLGFLGRETHQDD